jgi:hypothetical protein
LIAAASVLAIALALALGAGPTRAAATAGWGFAPALAPPAPPGVSPAPYPVPLGQVGQISFWAPNRGLLITGGTEWQGGVVPAGLYAYDGANWHQLSTVCGGAYGRIAWAGPDEFWTISDQRPGQNVGGGALGGDLESISLCHFRNGQGVGSYAMPLGVPSSYMRMDAAACLNASDCWFGGEDTTGPNPGAFQLHWDGSQVTALQEPEDHAVNDMTLYGGQIYESVRVGPGDAYLPSESTTHTPVLHTIGAGEAGPFTDVYTFGGGHVLPDEGFGVTPYALEGLSLGVDAPLGASSTATQLWAAANAAGATQGRSSGAQLTILRRSSSGWAQVLPAIPGSSPSPSCQPLPSGTLIDDWALNSRGGTNAGLIAPMPGSGSAWLAVDGGGGTTAAVALIGADGCVQRLDHLPGSGDAALGYLGDSGPIACPAANDCWMATGPDGSSPGGWLFHYTDGTQLSLDADPSFAGVIGYRPPDGATPSTYSTTPPSDDSLANQQTVVVPPPVVVTPPVPKRLGPLAFDLRLRLMHRTTLVMMFRLSAQARVQLLAFRRNRTVARTPRELLSAGRRQLTLRLSIKRWPTRIKLNATPTGQGGQL